MSLVIRIIVKDCDVNDILDKPEFTVNEAGSPRGTSKGASKSTSEEETRRTFKIFEGNTDNQMWVESGSFREHYPFFSYDHNVGTPIQRRWRIKSTLSCWYCTRAIFKKPIQLPFRKETIIGPDGPDELYHLKGCFCSFECAYTWNYHNEHFGDKWTQEALLYEIFYIVGGTGEIKMAPNKELLLQYGGKLTDEEYGKHLESSNLVSSINSLPALSLQPIIDFRTITYNEYSGKSETIKSEKSKDRGKRHKYLIYRKKPLFKSINNFFYKGQKEA